MPSFTKPHIIGITMWNKYKKSGKIVKTNRLQGNKPNNHVSVNQYYTVINRMFCSKVS